tara:strand:- start:1423 stop:1632 length:210 start_codon:yes stop_codon:yes gene_type:complete
MFKDKNGKISSKRVLGAFGVFVGFFLAIFPFFYESEYKPETVLILGIFTTSFASLTAGVFEKEKIIFRK